jgi:signal transduction histidine kinase
MGGGEMNTFTDRKRFLWSKSGRGFLLHLGFCAALSTVVGSGFYSSSLNWFKEHKSEEKIIALRLVDAFVTNYSAIRSRFGGDAPVPATFRAHSIETFNKQGAPDSDFRLRWVGREGRYIATPPADDKMAKTIEAFATTPSPKPQSEFLPVNGELTFRTVYPSLAREQSCVECHNKLQPTKTQWHLNDVMGAFAIDVPAAPFLHSILVQSASVGLSLFLVLDLVGLAISLMHFRQMAEREAAASELRRRVDERTTELRAAQVELLRNERLSTLGQLTATVAHELRNPLSSIRNTVFSIKEATARGSLDLERPITRVERNIGRCDRIISDLLEFTRNREIHRALTPVDSWLDEVLSDQRIPKGIQLVRKLGAPNCQAALDVDRMRRVVINLLDNAVHALTARESARERTITVRTNAAADRFELTVEDNGPGIPADVLPKVFDPLFSTKSFGTGLGLPTVKQIVDQHGGKIDISSEPNNGTRVVVRVPLADTEKKAA